jgi:hypothetical protein
VTGDASVGRLMSLLRYSPSLSELLARSQPRLHSKEDALGEIFNACTAPRAGEICGGSGRYVLWSIIVINQGTISNLHRIACRVFSLLFGRFHTTTILFKLKRLGCEDSLCSVELCVGIGHGVLTDRSSVLKARPRRQRWVLIACHSLK